MTRFDAWIGRETAERDMPSAETYERLAALLDHDRPPWPPGSVPPLGHWLNFLPSARQSQVGEDGHPRRGGVLPADLPPRRMWAASRVKFEAPLPFGARVERKTVIVAIAPKRGRSGDMVFVTLAHAISADGVLAVSEEQDIVYRAPPPAEDRSEGASASPPAEVQEIPAWSRPMTPDATLLFRFSALTFNAHRIHYDAPYARDVEGYPGLVVQGPLVATLLMDHYLRRYPQSRIASFSFRAVSPLFADAPVLLCGRERDGGADLWACGPGGGIAMRAGVEAV